MHGAEQCRVWLSMHSIHHCLFWVGLHIGPYASPQQRMHIASSVHCKLSMHIAFASGCSIQRTSKHKFYAKRAQCCKSPSAIGVQESLCSILNPIDKLKRTF